MFDREYFEMVLPKQRRVVGVSVTVRVRLEGRGDVEVRRVFAAHDKLIILEVYPPRERPGWVEGMPWEERWVFDQLAVPYESISSTEVTVRVPEEGEPEEEKRPVGFHAEGEPSSEK